MERAAQAGGQQPEQGGADTGLGGPGPKQAAPPGRLPGLADVWAAAARIRAHVHETPVLRCSSFDRELGAQLFFKCENLQKVGAFKARGACNAVLSLPPAAAAKGVITHSSGNHGAALAYAAGIRGIPATVVMPDDAPRVKQASVARYGAEVITCPRPEREAVSERERLRTGRTLIPPFDDRNVVAGAGTAALELCQQERGLDAVICPVGGGGLAAGTAVAARALQPGIRLLLAEPRAVDDAARSLTSGQLQPTVQGAKTCADGLMTGLGRLNFELLHGAGAEVVVVDEDEILQAAKDIVQRMKVVVEPSCATVLAALRRIRGEIAGQRIGVILTGANTDLGWFTT